MNRIPLTSSTLWLSLLIIGIAAADWLTAAGVVVGVLFCVPILLSSMGDDPRLVRNIATVSIGAFLVAAIFGRGPITPSAIWLPNRLFALVTIAASAPIALLLQKRRLAAESTRELNALLHSLMAHDLRSPLALARDALFTVAGTAHGSRSIDQQLLNDVDARLRRSLRSIDLVLQAARADIERKPNAVSSVSPADAVTELRDELASFEQEARSRAKTLTLSVQEALPSVRIDVPVLRQAVAILVDNAIRYAIDGTIHVTVSFENDLVCVSVRDEGPGLSAQTGNRQDGGLGIRLCELLASRAGGSLRIQRDRPDGSEFLLRLPAHPRGPEAS